MQFDLHVHTTLSACSCLAVDDILQHARARGLDGVCITDHDTMDIRHSIREGLQPDGLCVIIGMEYATPQGDFLIYGPFETLPSGLQAIELLLRVQREGGAAIAAHPFRVSRPADEALICSGLCRCAEGLNGRNHDLENLQTEKWRSHYGINLCGGSDAHSFEELGKVVTTFPEPIQSRQELIQALNCGGYQPDWNCYHNIDLPFSPAYQAAASDA